MDTIPTSANAIWYTAPGQVALRQEDLPALQPGEARVRTLYSGISRGTERLVSGGRVPQTEWTRMRAPMQQGDFPFPVKYGYCAVGIIEAGPSDLLGQKVFCLHPHQDRSNAPVDALAPLPDEVPPRRAAPPSP
jgi:NADPH:quinone reductase-like Zn-dependent oxidoreductase